MVKCAVNTTNTSQKCGSTPSVARIATNREYSQRSTPMQRLPVSAQSDSKPGDRTYDCSINFIDMGVASYVILVHIRQKRVRSSMSEQTTSDASVQPTTDKRWSILAILTWWRKIGEPI